MEFIRKNLDKVGIVNSILIAATIILRISQFGQMETIMKIDSIFCIIAMVFGLFYAAQGYKKAAANFYKVFMYLFFASSLVSLITPLVINLTRSAYASDIGTLTIVFNLVIAVCACVLAFEKNHGKDKSLKLTYLIIILNLVNFFIALIVIKEYLANIIGLSNLFLSCTACIFVIAKYVDKDARGTI